MRLYLGEESSLFPDKDENPNFLSIHSTSPGGLQGEFVWILCSSLTSLGTSPSPSTLPLQGWGGCVVFESKVVGSLCFLSFSLLLSLILARENKFLLENFGIAPIGVSGLQASLASSFGYKAKFCVSKELTTSCPLGPRVPNWSPSFRVFYLCFADNVHRFFHCT